jgi:hypothetical protein
LYRLLFIILLFSQVVFAQQRDAQLWTSLYAQRSVSKKILVHLEHQSFFINNITSYGQGYFDAGLTYKFNKHFKVLGDYVHVFKRQVGRNVSARYRYYFAFIAKQSFGRFDLVYRNRLQNQHVEPFTSENEFGNNLYDRNKISGRYEVNKYFQTYVSVEAYIPLSGPDHYIDRMRYATGLTYNLTSRHQLESYFMIQKHTPDRNGPSTDFIYGIGYNISLD